MLLAIDGVATLLVVATRMLSVDKSNPVRNDDMKFIMELVASPLLKVDTWIVYLRWGMHVAFNRYEIFLFFEGKGSPPDFH